VGIRFTAARLVDEHGIGVRPRRAARATHWPSPLDQPPLLGREQVAGSFGKELRLAEQPHNQPDRIDRRPDGVDELADRPGAGDRVLHAVVGDVAGHFHAEEDQVGQPLGE